MDQTRVVTGLKPSGRLHLGNLLGAVRPLLGLQQDPNRVVTVFVADLHALTTPHDSRVLRDRTREMYTTLLACDVDPARLFVQSMLPAHSELCYLLESTALHGEMTRMIQFRERSAASESFRLSLLTYPALMAADILLHRAELVPVGEDQRQHLELTKDLAQRFNSLYGEVFTLPQGFTPEFAARVKDLRDPGVKMGKSSASEAGTVFLLDPPEVIERKVRRAVTDQDPVLSYDPCTRPGVANLASILAAFTDAAPEAALAGLSGGAGLKRAVFEVLVERLCPIRERYRDFSEDLRLVPELAAAALDRVAPEAAELLRNARTAIGVGV